MKNYTPTRHIHAKARNIESQLAIISQTLEYIEEIDGEYVEKWQTQKLAKRLDITAKMLSSIIRIL